MVTKFYTYLLIDSRNKEPFYVGKGKENRALSHITRVNKNYQKTNSAVKNKIVSITRCGYEILTELYYCCSETDAYVLEKLLIKYIGRKDMKRGPLLNFTDGGEGGRPSYASILKISKKLLNMKRGKPVCQYTMDGELVSEFSSARQASYAVGVHENQIGGCCRGTKSTAAKFVWAYKNEIPKIFAEGNNKWTKIAQLSNGKILRIFPSVSRAAQHIHANPQSLWAVLRGKSVNVGGFQWKAVIKNELINPPRVLKARIKIYKLDDQQNIIQEFENLAQAARSVPTTYQNLFAACKNGWKCKNFYWKFASNK